MQSNKKLTELLFDTFENVSQNNVKISKLQQAIEELVANLSECKNRIDELESKLADHEREQFEREDYFRD